MIPRIFSLYGPLNINSYGFCIALGFLVFHWLCHRDKKMKNLVQKQTLDSLIVMGLVIGIIGGRLFYYISTPQSFESLQELLLLWQPGFSILGTIISISFFLPLFLYYKKISMLPVLDIFATYAGLLQSISRVGCFLAGCCYGTTSFLPWAVIYTDSRCCAPLGMSLHPVQLYSSISLFGIFLLMYYYFRPRITRPGTLLFIYLILVSIERCLLDFLRADRSMINAFFSVDQLVACIIIVISTTIFLYHSCFNTTKNYEPV